MLGWGWDKFESNNETAQYKDVFSVTCIEFQCWVVLLSDTCIIKYYDIHTAGKQMLSKYY